MALDPTVLGKALADAAAAIPDADKYDSAKVWTALAAVFIDHFVKNVEIVIKPTDGGLQSEPTGAHLATNGPAMPVTLGPNKGNFK